MKGNKRMYSTYVGLFVSAICFVLSGAKEILAAEYGASDIERMYINCTTELDALTKDDYVAAEITVVNKDGSIDMQELAGKVKLRGNSTSKAEKRPVNIKLDKKQSILGMEEGKKWCILANAFDKTLIRNGLAFDLANKMGLSYISQYRYVDLYFNNVYEGSYMVMEPVDPGSNLVDIEEEGDDFMLEVERERYEEEVTYLKTKSGIRFAINVPEVPTTTQLGTIQNKVNQVEDALRTYKYSEYSKYIDVDSFVNYYIVSEIFKAVDFNYSSTRFYCKDGKMYAGPLWDVDLSSGNASKYFYKGYYDGDVSYKDLFCTELKWYRYLFGSDEFVYLVNKRMNEMLPTIKNMYETNGLGTNMIDKLMESYKPSFLRNYAPVSEGGAGWSIVKRYSTCDNQLGLEYHSHPATYDENVEFLRTWLKNRVDYLQTEWSNRDKNNAVKYLKVEKKTNTTAAISWYNQGVADGSEVYVKTKGEKFKLVKTVNGELAGCTVKNLKPGVKYYFKVRSYVNFGDERLYTDFSESVKLTIPFKSPKVKINKATKKVTLKWKKVKGADGYYVYSVNKKGKLKRIATIKNPKKVKYVVKKIKKNVKTYKVKAYVKVNGKKITSR